MKADVRRDLLARLKEARLQDGMVPQLQLNQLVCDALTILLMDSVYLEIPQDADLTPELEVEAVDA